MKTIKIILLCVLVCLFVGCEKDKIKSPYFSNFVGKYSITENYVAIGGEGDTIATSTKYYTLLISGTRDNKYDLQFNAIDAYIFEGNVKANILDDSTFSFEHKFPAYDSFGVIRGDGIINLASNTIKMNYTACGPNAHGYHFYNATGTKIQ